MRLDDALIEPICQAGLLRLPDDRVLFSNPASTRREQMTVRVSADRCRTWSAGVLLHDGPAAYSDLALAADGRVCCLYERGDAHAYERITLARLRLQLAFPDLGCSAESESRSKPASEGASHLQVGSATP